MTLRCATLLTPRRLKALSAAAFVWDVHEAPASDEYVVDTWIDFSTEEELRVHGLVIQAIDDEYSAVREILKR